MLNRANNDRVISHDRDRGKGLIQKLWNAPGAIALGLLLLVVSGCNGAEEPTTEVAPDAEVAESPVAESPAASPTASPVAGSRNAELVGENVTVSTKVMRIINPNAFIVQDKESLGGQEVLVVSDFNSPAVAVGNNIELTGVVEEFVVADVEKEYGFDLEPGIETEFREKPYVAAKAIEKVD